MKALTLILLGCLATMNALAYTNIANDLEIYSASGLKFNLYVHGKLIDEGFSDRITISNTNYDVVSVRVVFEDKSIPVLERSNLMINFPGNRFENKPTKTVFKIVRKKNRYKLKKVSRTFKEVSEEEPVTFQVD